MRYNGLELKIALPIRQQPDDLWQQLLALAERAEPATKDKFLEAIAKLRDDLDVPRSRTRSRAATSPRSSTRFRGTTSRTR
jgi:hypothetical protein